MNYNEFIDDKIIISEETKAFFGDNIGLIDLFLNLLNYAKTIDSRIVMKKNSSIIGIAFPEGFYAFYISKDENEFFIKFKHEDNKEIFCGENENKYYKQCDGIVRILLENPEKYTSRKKESKEIIKEDLMGIVEECNQALSLCKDYFLANKVMIDEFIQYDRVKNALKRAGIFSCDQLVNADAEELIRIKNLGRKSMFYIKCRCCEFYEKGYKLFTEQNTVWEQRYRERINNLDTFWDDIYNKTSRALGDSLLEEVLIHETNEMDEYYEELELLFKNVFSEEAESNRNTKIFVERVFNKRTLESIGQEYDLSRERVRQIINKQSRKALSRFGRGKFDVEISKRVKDLLLSVDDEIWLDFLYLVWKRNSLWFLAKKIMTNDFENLEYYLKTIEYKKAIENNEKMIADKLPQLLEMLNKGDRAECSIYVAKHYTKEYGRSIWSDRLFIEIANAYLRKQDKETAKKFIDLVKRRNTNEYRNVIESINS